MPLLDELEARRKEIRSEEMGMSIGEFISMYKENEIDIHPKYQRFFRWTDNQKTRLIESILLGIPIPQIFIHQREDGVWDVVDGVQRLSTIFEFVGILKDEEGKVTPPLILSESDLLKSLDGKKWDDKNDKENSFNSTVQLFFKRSKLNISIIQRESGDDVKYELFQRLNTGGSSLSEQEVRNCILVMENKDMYEWIKSLSEFEPFRNATSLSEKLVKEQFDIELILRFLIFKDIDIEEVKSVRDVNKHITTEMINIAKNNNFDFEEEERIFKDSFSTIDKNVGTDSVFKRYDVEKDRFMGGFILSAYELIAYGIGYNAKKKNEDINLEKMKSAFSDDRYTNFTGPGKKVTQRLPKLLELGRELFKHA